MREILFRGQNEANIWHYGAWIPYESGEAAILSKFSAYGCEAVELCQRCKVIPETIGQYTGCCDKSKTTKVFEGDIVWDEINERYGVVEFDEGEFIVNFNGSVDAERCADVISNCYVCGNIHDNPELIR